MMGLRAQLDGMREHLSGAMKSMEARLVQLQEENEMLEKQIHEINIAKTVEIQMMPNIEEQDANNGVEDDRQSQINLNAFEGGILKRRIDMLQDQFKDFQSTLNSHKEREERFQAELSAVNKKAQNHTMEYRTKLEALLRQVAEISTIYTRASKQNDVDLSSTSSTDLRKLMQDMFDELKRTFGEQEKQLIGRTSQAEALHNDMQKRYDRLRKHQNALVEQILRDAATGMTPKDRQTLRDEMKRLRDDLDAAQARHGDLANTEAFGKGLMQQQLEMENTELKTQNDRLMDQCKKLRGEVESLQEKAMNAATSLPSALPPTQPHQQQPQYAPQMQYQDVGRNSAALAEAQATIQQLRFMLLTRQQTWEEERAKLLVRCTIAEQQLETLLQHSPMKLIKKSTKNMLEEE
jgi:chromosome segregation ATPase